MEQLPKDTRYPIVVSVAIAAGVGVLALVLWFVLATPVGPVFGNWP